MLPDVFAESLEYFSERESLTREAFLAKGAGSLGFWGRHFEKCGLMAEHRLCVNRADLFNKALRSGFPHLITPDDILDVCQVIGVHPAHLLYPVGLMMPPLPLVQAIAAVAMAAGYSLKDRRVAIDALKAERRRLDKFLENAGQALPGAKEGGRADSIFLDADLEWVQAPDMQAYKGPKCESADLSAMFGISAYASGGAVSRLLHLQEVLERKLGVYETERRKVLRNVDTLTKTLMITGEALFGADTYPDKAQKIFESVNRDGFEATKSLICSEQEDILSLFRRHARRATVMVEGRVLRFDDMRDLFMESMRECMLKSSVQRKLVSNMERMKGKIDLICKYVVDPDPERRTHIDAYETHLVIQGADLAGIERRLKEMEIGNYSVGHIPAFLKPAAPQ